MHIYHLSKQTIDAYLHDLVDRLAEMEQAPDVLLGVTGSGRDMLPNLAKVIGGSKHDKLHSCRLATIGKNSSD
jgi:hypothetical protein